MALQTSKSARASTPRGSCLLAWTIGWAAAPQFGPWYSTWIGLYVAVGSKGDKPRQPKHRLPKVPKYEEPNTLPLPGLVGGATAPGPAGDGGSHQHSLAPGRAGKALLWLLGRRPKDPNPTS
jgi:hypothetical protein